MKRLRTLVVAVVVVTLGLAAGLWLGQWVDRLAEPDRHGEDAVLATLRSAETMELFSLHPWEKSTGSDSFHGWRVFGTVAVTDPDARRELANAMRADVYGGQSFMCFDPRHGVRLTGPLGTVDLAICFECGLVEAHGIRGDRWYPTGRTAQPVSDRLLTVAGVPLHKPGGAAKPAGER